MEKYFRVHNNGVLSVPSGVVDIMDPSYEQDCWCAMTGVSVRKGDYISLSYYANDFYGWGRRTAILQMVHEDYFHKIDTSDKAQWEELGSVGVDAGLMSISQSPKPDYSDQQWQKFCKITDGPNKRLGTIQKIQNKPILVSSSGIGDGYYPVFCLRNSEKEIVAVEIRFTAHPFLCGDEESEVS